MFRDRYEFEWDIGNTSKIEARFQICEVEAFFKQDLLIMKDVLHSDHELRFLAMGLGPSDRPVLVCFTFRETKIRVISARYMNKKEAKAYETIKEERERST